MGQQSFFGSKKFLSRKTIGSKKFLSQKENWVKKGAIIIDVGMNRLPPDADGKSNLAGDVDYDDVKKMAGAVTPVPGGVGPMTIACLLKNTITAACALNDIETPQMHVSFTL